MPFAGTWKLEEEPIIITAYAGEVTAEILLNGYARTAELITRCGAKQYLILDMTEVSTSFAEVMTLLKHQRQTTPGATVDPRLEAMVVVGAGRMLRLYVDALRQGAASPLQGATVPMYASIEDALAALRVMIKQRCETQQPTVTGSAGQAQA